MTPAEELTAAATKLRETYAALAACGDIRGQIDLSEWSEWFGPDDVSNLPVVNAWIRLMHPGLAESLAAWLESSAADAAHTKTIRTTSVLHALDVARVINGGAS